MYVVADMVLLAISAPAILKSIRVYGYWLKVAEGDDDVPLTCSDRYN